MDLRRGILQREPKNQLSKDNPEIRKLLDAIIPPINGFHASTTLITRAGVQQQSGILEELLSVRQAKKSGVCSIKEEVFANVFDELIRQETIKCPERGLVLSRCRDQLKLTLMAYRTLSEYGSAQKFAHTSLSCEGAYEKICKERQELESKVKSLEIQLVEAKKKANYDASEIGKEFNSKKEFYETQKSALESHLQLQD